MTADPLHELERIAREAHADAIAEEARALAERAAEGRFYVACVGQFKRGKSTLLNALVGAAVLPTGTVPVTSVPTLLRHGEYAARVRCASGAWEEIDPTQLADFVSEERNPGNTKRVTAVEVFVPCDLLASGLCFVDTPGLGSVSEANSEATRAFVPHIDAALVVLGADPPLSAEELRLVEAIAQEVDTLIFLLNKVDRVTEAEREEAARFTRRVLSERLGRSVAPLFQVSALNRLSHSGENPDWEALEGHLRTLAEESGRTLVAGAMQRGRARLGTRLMNILVEETVALQRPLTESEQRLDMLRAAVKEAHQALRELEPLFAAEEEKIGEMFAARREAFLKATLPEAEAARAREMCACGARTGPAGAPKSQAGIGPVLPKTCHEHVTYSTVTGEPIP